MSIPRVSAFLFFAPLLWTCGEVEPVQSSSATGASATAAGRSDPESEGPTIAFLGDSICAGLHLAQEEAFPAVLRRELGAAGRPFRLVNAGVSGDTAAGGLRRVDWILAQSPDAVVVELGNNDGLRGQPLETIEANLRGILEKLAAAEVAVLLLGCKIPPNYGRDYSDGFEKLYARLAEEFEVAFVPFFLEGVGGVDEMNLEDGLHPTAEGHVTIAEHLEPAVHALIEDLSSAER